MDQAGGATAPSNAALGNDAAVRLLNDVRFVLFPLLPAELRRAIWLLLLQQYRSIDMYLRDGYISEEDKLQRYTRRNHLGKIVSGRGYLLAIRRLGYAATLSPLLRVNGEARQLTLDFYRVHLPFRQGSDGERLLYLNPIYDTLLIEPDDMSFLILHDFLHDIKAHEPRDQGFALEQLAICHQQIHRPRGWYGAQLEAYLTTLNPSNLQALNDNARLYNQDLHRAGPDTRNNQPAGGEASGGDLRATLRQETTEMLQSNKNR